MEGSESYRRLLRHPQNGKIFLPINIDGVEQADHFMTIPKIVSLGLMVALLLLILANSSQGGINIFLGLFLWSIVATYTTRYIIFEEKRYYKAYLQTKKVEICTPAEFFKITAVRETPAGSVIMFQNGQVGILVKLERGTVVGRPSDFMGEHYDAMSEMYRALLKANLKFLLLDVCESTGNESTVDALGRLTVNSANKNINKLMELQVGFMKTLVNDTIYSKDYMLIYTDAARIGTLIAESEEALRMSLEGAIDGYEFMDQNGISTFVSEYFGVGFFSGEDVLRSGVIRKAFKVVGVEYTDGIRISIGDEERKKLEKQVKCVEDGSCTARQLSLRKALSAKGDTDDGPQGFITDIPQATAVSFDTPPQAYTTPQSDFNFGGYNPPQSQFGGFPASPTDENDLFGSPPISFQPQHLEQTQQPVSFEQPSTYPDPFKTQVGGFPQQSSGFPQQNSGFPKQEAGYPQQQQQFGQQTQNPFQGFPTKSNKNGG